MIRRYWPILAGSIFLMIGMFASIWIAMQHTDKMLAYPTDDTYIHMAIARNFVQHGVWGGNQHEFASLTSSPLYTLLLAGTYKIFGVNIWLPLAINIIAGLAVCVISGGLFRVLNFHPLYSFVIIMLIILLTPLWTLMYTGMEHTLHTLFAILFVYYAGQCLGSNKWKKKQVTILLIIAPAMVATRYEGLFMLGLFWGMLCLRRKYIFAMTIFLIGCMPVVIYGFLSISKGWFFLPNSVLLKGGRYAHFTIDGLFNYLGNIVNSCPFIYVLILLLLVLLFIQFGKKKTVIDAPFSMGLITLLTILTHMFFASTGWFFRYEAYLIAVTLFVTAILLQETINWKSFNSRLVINTALFSLAVFSFLLPLFERSKRAFEKLPFALRNIYEQQCQMAFFVREFYDNQKIVLDDIGAVAFFTNADIFDSYGLMNLDVARNKLNDKHSALTLYELIKTENPSIAIVYDKNARFSSMSDSWVCVGSWQILDNVVCAGDTVRFISLHPQEQEYLVDCLRKYSRKLPKSVIQSGLYMEAD